MVCPNCCLKNNFCILLKLENNLKKKNKTNNNINKMVMWKKLYKIMLINVFFYCIHSRKNSLQTPHYLYFFWRARKQAKHIAICVKRTWTTEKFNDEAPLLYKLSISCLFEMASLHLKLTSVWCGRQMCIILSFRFSG